MITGKVISLHIAETSIRVAEAFVNKGMIDVQNAFVINNVNRFFNRGRLINMAAMVDAITMAITTNGMTSKRILIAYENAFTTTFSIEPISSMPEKKFSLFSKKEDKDDVDPDQNGGATIKHVHKWGQYITQDEQGEAVSVTLAEYDMVQSMVGEFRNRGFKVISIEPPDTALIYARNTVECNYDSMNKIVIRADNEEIGDLYIMTKDVPSTIKRIQFDAAEGNNLMERIRGICQNEINRGQMRNPYVYLIGDAFAYDNEYIRIAEDLECEGIQVVDLYGYGMDYSQLNNAVQIHVEKEAGALNSELTSEFGICMCLFLHCLDKKPENMVESKYSFSSLARKRMTVVRAVEAFVAVVLVANVALTAITGFEAITVNKTLADANELRSELTKTEDKRDNARLQIKALGTIDTRLQEIFTFVYENVDPTLNIASVDTLDMIPVKSSSESQYEEENKAGTGSSPQTNDANKQDDAANQQPAPNPNESELTEYEKKTLVIRGYSMKTEGPVALYNALAAAGIGDVQLVGQQQMLLPSGEVIYAFEMRAGEVGAAQ